MLDGLELDGHLLERCKYHPGPENEEPEFVIHWMRSAIRLQESPTFDVARVAARSLDLPLLIYHGIDERYPYASYRHHRFLLEGAADVADHAESLGVDHLVHVSREGNRGPFLKRMAREAALVVTDMADLSPWDEWTSAVSSECQLIEVDSHCVLPRPVFGKSKDRPFRFRNSTGEAMRERVSNTWPDLEFHPKRIRDGWDPPFEPVDARMELQLDGGARLLSQCRIDPTVVPVTDIRGGECAALEHWEEWCDSGLKRYHARRNNAADRSGVSGISPWIHYGMLAPTRVVRDAARIGGKGAEKFLDEMLVFREHAQHHAHAVNNPEDWSNIPGWARESLEGRVFQSEGPNVSDMERGESGDELWDSAQIGLIRHGVMHNNVRMTWGKAFAGWIEEPAEAMRVALEFNDRFALDGRDPSSIAGVQWCFGLFDRAFGPPDPVLGKIRKRATSSHRKRLDFPKYKSWTENATMGGSMRVGIVGGGLSGLFAGRLLNDLGHDVTVWDKGSRAGGRLTAVDSGGGEKLKIGSETLDSVPPWFQRLASGWVDEDIIEIDEGSIFPKESLVSLLEVIGEGLNINHLCRVEEIREDGGSVEIRVETESREIVESYDRLIVATPVEQAISLCSGLDLNLRGKSESCLVAWGPSKDLDGPVPEGFVVSRYGEGKGMMVKLDPIMSDKILEYSKEEMVAEVTSRLGVPSEGWRAHRWRFSRAISGSGSVKSESRVSVIGDAFGMPIGTAGASLDSAARAVANLHLTPISANFRRKSTQTTLSNW